MWNQSIAKIQFPHMNQFPMDEQKHQFFALVRNKSWKRGKSKGNSEWDCQTIKNMKRDICRLENTYGIA